MRLGDFGTPAEEVEPDTFGYFGEELRVNPEFVDADVLDFMEQGSKVDAEDPTSMLFVKEFVRRVIHPEDFERFWELASKHRQTIEQRLMVVNEIIEAVAERPTRSSTDSSDGRQATEQKSTDDLSSRVLQRLDGRPDLQVIVEEAQKARVAG